MDRVGGPDQPGAEAVAVQPGLAADERRERRLYAREGGELFPAHRLLPVRAADRPPPHPDLRTLRPGRPAVLVQLLAGPGRHSRPGHAAGHLHADPRHDVRGGRVTARRLCQGGGRVEWATDWTPGLI